MRVMANPDIDHTTKKKAGFVDSSSGYCIQNKIAGWIPAILF
jgi:hypothetical protein